MTNKAIKTHKKNLKASLFFELVSGILHYAPKMDSYFMSKEAYDFLRKEVLRKYE